MGGNTFFVCVYYFSLPEFPNDCAIVRDNSLLVRDVLVSNPSNKHVIYGGQYDPHYEHDSAPEFKMCWKSARRKIMSVLHDSSYNEIYLLFRTNKVSLSGMNNRCMSGYYSIDPDKVLIDPDYEEPVLYAKEARFLAQRDAVDISDFLTKTKIKRCWFSSQTRKAVHDTFLNRCKEKIDLAQNLFDRYKERTKELDKIFKYYEFEDGPYALCKDCVNNQCFLMKRIRRKGKLYHQLPHDIADRINRYYKRTIKILL